MRRLGKALAFGLTVTAFSFAVGWATAWLHQVAGAWAAAMFVGLGAATVIGWAVVEP